MIEIYVTETETVYPDNRPVEIHLWGRTEGGESGRIVVEGFDPYFYIPAKDKDEYEPKDLDDLERFEEAEKPSLFRDELVKVVASHPGAVPSLKDHYDDTFEADVLFTNRLRIDEEIYTGVRAEDGRVSRDGIEPVEMEDAPVRYLYYDIEVDDRDSMPVQGGELLHTDSAIVSISAYDSFEGEYHGFLALGERTPGEVIEGVMESGDAPGCLDKLHYYYDEKTMLKEYLSWVAEVNPDLLLAWNGNEFDAPYLIERCEYLDVDPGTMGRGEQNTYYGNDPNVAGRVCYDLMEAWEAMQYTDVSSSLENAATMELGADEGKLKHEDSIYEMWRDDAARLMEYNAKDVELMVDINEQAGVMQDREELKDSVGVDYQQTIDAKDFISMLTRRMLHEWQVAGPTKSPPDQTGDDYEGAHTFEAFDGRRHNVVSIDLASLYPFTMRMLNSSPERKVAVYEDAEAAREAYESGEYEDDMVSFAPNGAMFSLEEDGLFRALVDKALELTRQAGRRRDSAEPGSDEWEYWNQVREARKRIRNGLYGVLGWVWFFLYDEPTAEAVTTMAREVIKTSAEHIDEETKGEVIYGDTDSCYISWPDDWSITKALEETESVVEELNNEVYPELATEYGMPADSCEWEIEIEDASETIFQSGKKKRYAKKRVWKEGMDFDERLDDASVKIVGYEYKRSDCAPLLEDLQKKVLTDIVTGADDATIRERVFEAAQEIDRTDADFGRIGIPGGIGKKLDNYESDTAQVRAAKAGNEVLDLSMGKGDKPKRVYIEEKTIKYDDRSFRTDVIGFEDARDLEPIEDQLYVDVARMQETVIERPMGRILDPIDIDVQSAMRGQRQQKITDLV